MLSDRSQRKTQFKSCCIHWIKLTTIPKPSTKDTFFWLSLQVGEVIKQNIKKEQIQSQIRKYPCKSFLIQSYFFQNNVIFSLTGKPSQFIAQLVKKKSLIFIGKYVKQTRKFSSQQDLLFINHEKLNPFKIRQLFLKPIDQENMFLSNLQNPESFQKQKSNCAIFISSYQNSFLESVIRLLAFNPTFSSLVEKIDSQKIKSISLKQLIKVIKILRTGKFRMLNIKEFQDVFFSQFPELLSYENHDPIKVIFIFFKLIENQFGWKDRICHPKEILKTPRLEWNISKNDQIYSPLKQMLLSKTKIIEICSKCQKEKNYLSSISLFECLTLEMRSESISVAFMKKKSNQLNILKEMQKSLGINQSKSQQDVSFCEHCLLNTDHKFKAIIEPGNYILFNIQQNENLKITIPKEFDFRNLSSDKFIVNEVGTEFEFVAGIYKEFDQKLSFGISYGTVVNHIQNSKYLCFSENKITQHQNLNLEKNFSVLLYKRKPNVNLLPIIKNIKSTLYLMEQQGLQVDNPIPLPDFYDIFLTENYQIPPLVNPFICHHGLRNLNIDEMTKCSKIQYLPVEIYNFLVDQFGGRKISLKMKENFQQECQFCVKGFSNYQKIKAIEREVMKYADNFSIKKGQVLVYKPWINCWKAYLYEKTRDNYSIWGNPPPSQIDNYLGMRGNDPKQIDHSKYTKISNEVWMTLVVFHSGGPQLTTKKIIKNNCVKNYANLKLNQAKLFYQELIKALSPQFKVFFQQKINSQFSSFSVSDKQQQDNHVVSSGSQDQETDNLSIKSASKSKSKPRSRILISNNISPKK